METVFIKDFFSVKSFYEALDSTSASHHPCLLVWLGLAPPRVKVFVDRHLQGKFSTVGI